MKCKEAIDAMSDAIEQTLPATTRIAFDCHLAACRACSLYLSQVRVTIELAARLHAKPASDLHRTLLARAR